MDGGEPNPKRAKLSHEKDDNEQDDEAAAGLSDVILTLSRSPRVTVQLKNIRSAEIRVVDTEEDFHRLLSAEAERANRTKEKWIRDPSSWLYQHLLSELTPEQQSEIKQAASTLQKPKQPSSSNIEAPISGLARAGDPVKEDKSSQTEPKADADDVDLQYYWCRWDERAKIATNILHAWFKGKTLKDVLAKQKELGTMDDPSGYIIDGAFARGESDPCMVMEDDIDIPRLLETINLLSPKIDDPLKTSLYSTQDENSFMVEKVTEVATADLKDNLAEKTVGKGSLNTVTSYGADTLCDVDCLDDYYEAFDSLFHEWAMKKRKVPCVLNKRFYFIWKFPEYTTAYHQDVHVPAHFTLYNQLSGCSVFHFLPLLVGTFLVYRATQETERPKTEIVAELKESMLELDRQEIGRMAVIHPGDLLLILPYASHGVWVPHIKDNESWVDAFQVSSIRAAELFIQPIYRDYRRRLMANDVDWRSMGPPQQQNGE